MPLRRFSVDELLQFAAQLPPEELIEYLEKLHRLIQEKQANAGWLKDWSMAITALRDRATSDAWEESNIQTDQIFADQDRRRNETEEQLRQRSRCSEVRA